MASIPNLGTRDPLNADRKAGNASNGVTPGSSAKLLKGGGSIGGAQEAGHQPSKKAHPQGPFVDRDGNRFRMPSC